MRIVARHARQRVTLLKALAFAQVGRLVGDVVVFRMLRPQAEVVIVEWFTGAIAERRSAMLQGVAVAVSTQIHQSLPRQRRRTDHAMRLFLGRKLLVKVHVLAAWSVADFARHAENGILGTILIAASWQVFE